MGARRARGGTRRRVLRSRHHAGSDAGDEVLETGRGACNAKLSPPCSQRSELPGLSSVLHARYYSLTRSPRRVCVCVCLFVGMPKAAEWRWEVLAPKGCGSTAPEPFWFKYDETPEWRWEVLSPGGCGGTAPYLLWSKYDETPEWRWEILSPEGCG